MEMVALDIANRVLEGEDPKEIFRKLSAAKKVNVRYGGHKHPVRPCEEWPDFENLDEWQQVAITELEDDLNIYFTLDRKDDDQITVEGADDHNWTIYKDDATARQIAINQVVADIENEPETYVGEWCYQFINVDRLKRDLRDFARDDDYWNEGYPEYGDKVAYLMQNGKLDEDPMFDEEGNEIEMSRETEHMIDGLWEEMIEEVTNEKLEDPVQFLKDIYGEEDGIKQAIEQGGIDAQAAAEYAVDADGWPHTLGNSHDLPSGAVYVRE